MQASRLVRLRGAWVAEISDVPNRAGAFSLMGRLACGSASMTRAADGNSDTESDGKLHQARPAMPAVCAYPFKEAGRPRASCGLPAVPDGQRCPLHSTEQQDRVEVAALVVAQASLPEHWMEGALLGGVKLQDHNLRGVKMPAASLEGAYLARTVLSDSNLRRANLSSVKAIEADLRNADLSGARLDNSIFAGADLRDANLSGASLRGAAMERTYMLGIRLADAVTASEVQWGESGEFSDGHWLDAARASRSLGAHFRSIGDYVGSVDAYYREMTALHLRAVHAERADQWLRFWPLHCLGASAGWGIHRLFWGYGVRPWRVVVWMLTTIGVFGALVFPVLGTTASAAAPPSHSVAEGMSLSLVTFATLGYGSRVPVGALGEILGGLEALLGALMISAFLVALAMRYVHRG